ncbi:hypothetical protein CYMTET_51652 [Cymbomonas tetramitiformis]|uniref:Uncharacterized protein n=1 Tax=Cymbomonas tetramitiformis TaxID=36881 RepID=A0AAE0BLV5_9CHLO|nr:hypothetical protein CYMTET_51652 [Cymbomonas tetramitiformis]
MFGLVQSVAAAGYQAPGVIVSYTDDATIAAKFKKAGFQIAVGVPFMIDEPAGLQTFRIGLFGLDKVSNPEATLATLEAGLDQALAAV